jgi:hypothetical protein
MKFELNFLPKNATDDDIFEEIRRIDSLVGKAILTRTDYDKHSKIHSTTLVRRFDNWQKVLTKAGLGDKYSGRSVTDKMLEQKAKFLTDDEIIIELQRIAKLLNKNSITVDDIKHNSAIIGPKIISRRFGTWANGIKKASLEVSQFGHRYSDEEYFENLLNVWTHYGRQPLLREMNQPPSEITSGAYENKFGGWRKALEAFVFRMNQEEQVDEGIKKEPEKIVRQEIKKHSIAVEDKRGIPLGLRYKVLSRDSFKCVRCGRSPATTLGIELHIDHKLPFSMGGKTVLENLETKCKECNLGKSNRHSE